MGKNTVMQLGGGQEWFWGFMVLHNTSPRCFPNDVL